MQPGSLVGKQVVVHGLAQERVPERKSTPGAPEEVRVEQRPEGVVQPQVIES